MKMTFTKKMRVGATALALLLTTGLFAQDDLNWVGASSSDYADPANWDPQGNIGGNNVIIGHAGSYTYECFIGTNASPVDEDINLNSLNVSAGETVITETDTTDYPRGIVNICMAEGKWFQTNSGNYNVSGFVNVTGGNFRAGTGYFRMYESSDTIYFNCDTVTSGSTFFISGSGSGTSMGGYAKFSGNTLLIIAKNGIDRIPSNIPDSLRSPSIVMEDNASMILKGNDYTTKIQDAIDKGIIVTDEDKDIVVKYDATENSTRIYLRSSTAFGIEPDDQQVLIAGMEGSMIQAFDNVALQEMESLEWKFGTTPGGPYNQTFTPAETNNSIVPNFKVTGNFYLVLEGTKGGQKYYTNEVNCVVSTDKVVVSPADLQTLRLGQDAATLTVTEKGTATGREWKYATTQGGPYSSFSPAGTGTDFMPTFTETGMYYVVCVSEIDGLTLTSSEVAFSIIENGAGALNLVFNGSVSTDGDDLLNWSPVAYPYKNDISILDSAMNAVFSKTGTDTIKGLNIGKGALLTVNKPSLNDTLVQTGGYPSSGGTGSWSIEGGVYVGNNWYRFDAVDNKFTVKNNAKAIFTSDVMMANSSSTTTGSGGTMSVMDNGVIEVLGTLWRISYVKGVSEFYLQDNGKYMIKGDVTSSFAKYLNNVVDEGTGDTTQHQKFITPEGFTPYMYYDPSSDYTIIEAVDLSAFNIAETGPQIVGAGSPSRPLSLVNTDGYSSFEWIYSTTPVGPWETYSTGPTATFTFNEAGIKYIKCVGDAKDTTSIAVTIEVIEFNAAPGNFQSILPFSDGTPITVTRPEGMSTVDWKVSITPGSGYESFDPVETDTTYVPFFYINGDYYVVCTGTILDANGQEVVVVSNEIHIEVTDTPNAIDDEFANAISVYPNPSTGAFSVQYDGQEAYTVEVFNLNGASLKKVAGNIGNVTQIHMNQSGVYLVKIVSGDNVKVERMIIQ